ncbi:hypothetical protein WJX74_006654 [Apatococcus lobatus]|uniref:Uncharacterized protein n=1 Tax=Apatococcus lobatus TaxID=904363 RepID=A0AAW1Q533_9CHLO
MQGMAAPSLAAHPLAMLFQRDLGLSSDCMSELAQQPAVQDMSPPFCRSFPCLTVLREAGEIGLSSCSLPDCGRPSSQAAPFALSVFAQTWMLRHIRVMVLTCLFPNHHLDGIEQAKELRPATAETKLVLPVKSGLS